MNGGTFNVARSIWDHPVFAKGECSEREAFLWLLSNAAWKPRTVRVASYVIDLERGQVCASVRFMAESWGWSKSRVARFLAKLRERTMIKNRDSGGTAPLVLTICNYDRFQGPRDSGETEPGQQRDSSGTNKNPFNPIKQQSSSLPEPSGSISVPKPATEPPERMGNAKLGHKITAILGATGMRWAMAGQHVARWRAAGHPDERIIGAAHLVRARLDAAHKPAPANPAYLDGPIADLAASPPPTKPAAFGVAETLELSTDQQAALARLRRPA